jgi:hypothetical protein
LVVAANLTSYGPTFIKRFQRSSRHNLREDGQGDAGLATITKSAKAFREATRKCLPRAAKNGPVRKGGAGRIRGKSSRELELVYQNEGQKLVVCYGCFSRVTCNL